MKTPFFLFFDPEEHDETIFRPHGTASKGSKSRVSKNFSKRKRYYKDTKF
jgi:hypothetical protein